MKTTRPYLSLLLLNLAAFALISCGKDHKHRAPPSPELPTDNTNPPVVPVNPPLDNPKEPRIFGTDWYNLSPEHGGAHVSAVYDADILQDKQEDVIVAVIDTGIDVTHEDLKDHLWVNPKEIADNGIDDDNNGYVDDIHGWNFMVDANGKSIERESYEVVREWNRLSKLDSQGLLPEADRPYFEEVKAIYEKAPSYLLQNEINPRADDLQDFTPISAEHKAYGNNDLRDAHGHGTSVAGIIAADRLNEVGVKGIAQRARIMTLRAVPDGDEYDKDIFHAVRYATDHGAKIINMSFGKNFSPHKEKVQEAFAYAYERGVLLVHAAGNSGMNMDIERFFPSRAINGSLAFEKVWLEVGASVPNSRPTRALFSNYGRKNVDLLAPGFMISLCSPGSDYNTGSGTSFASPVVAGVAALVLSNFPKMTAVELRQVMLDSVRKADAHGESYGLDAFAATGGIVDAYELMQRVQIPSLIDSSER